MRVAALAAPHNLPTDFGRSMPGVPSISALRDDSGSKLPGFEVVDFTTLPPVACPCGWARRGLADVADFPGTIHVTEISESARWHYHKRLTETYFVLECEPGAQLQLDDQCVDLHPGTCVLIRPGVRHRAIGKMKVLILVLPKFDAEDEWFDDDAQ
jgi:mannose-6-phosphate isomerase-like protein (cupin superfamily)